MEERQCEQEGRGWERVGEGGRGAAGMGKVGRGAAGMGKVERGLGAVLLFVAPNELQQQRRWCNNQQQLINTAEAK